MSDEPDAADNGDGADRDEGTLTVLLALAANVAVGVLKLAAGLISGSGALLSEAAHSVGDSTTEILLLVALRRSDRPADARHPFGYGKERYFWSLLAAGAIFVSGAAFSIYEGLHTIFGGDERVDRQAVDQLPGARARRRPRRDVVPAGDAAVHARRRSARARSLRALIRDPEDPTVNSVAMEDSAALVGIVIAAAGVGLHQLTGSSV